jgi:thiamine pyrophosphate-dependent acetolactate synthase large subunit-like protein
MGTTTLHQALAQSLSDAGVDTMFGVMGDGNLWLIDTFVRDRGGDYVAATHEANAVTMASGYGKRTGRLAVATVTHGPGLTNTVTALVDAARARIPMLVVIGDTAAEMRDHSQRLAQRDVVLPTGAGFEQVRSPRTAVTDFWTAVRRAHAEGRPVVLNIPRPFLLAEVAAPSRRRPVPERQAVQADPEALDTALGILASAQRPLVLGGRGAMTAGKELIALADATGALLATTLQGQSLFRGHPYDLGILGSLSTEAALEAIDTTDVVVAFGASLNRHTTAEGALLRGKGLVQVDIRPRAFGRFVEPDAEILGDAAAVATAMTDLLIAAEFTSDGARGPRLEAALAASREAPVKPMRTQGALDVRLALSAIAAALPETRSVTTDLGRFVIDAWKAVTAPTPDRYVHTNNFGSIGLGVGYALGMTYAAPDEPVVLVTGDGGFMMGGLAELSTAVRGQRDLLIVVVNDGAYGAEHVQFRNRDMDPSLTTLEWPDIAAVASAIGVHSVTVRSMSDLDDIGETISRRPAGPMLIDLLVHPEDVLARGFA